MTSASLSRFYLSCLFLSLRLFPPALLRRFFSVLALVCPTGLPCHCFPPCSSSSSFSFLSLTRLPHCQQCLFLLQSLCFPSHQVSMDIRCDILPYSLPSLSPNFPSVLRKVRSYRLYTRPSIHPFLPAVNYNLSARNVRDLHLYSLDTSCKGSILLGPSGEAWKPNRNQRKIPISRKPKKRANQTNQTQVSTKLYFTNSRYTWF